MSNAIEKPVLTVLEQEVVTLVGLRGGAETGKLTHRPETVAVAVAMDAAGVRVFTGCVTIGADGIQRSVDDLQRNVGDRPVDAPEPGPRRAQSPLGTLVVLAIAAEFFDAGGYSP